VLIYLGLGYNLKIGLAYLSDEACLFLFGLVHHGPQGLTSGQVHAIGLYFMGQWLVPILGQIKNECC
jgi:hypothetical protein